MTAVALQIQYQVGTETGEQAVASLAVAFERAGEEIRDFSTYVFPRLVPVFEQALEEQFNAEGHGPVTGSWADLSVQYAKWKSASYPGKGKLQLTGKLMAALTGPSANAYRKTTATEFDFGTIGIPYASFHQTGTPWMPARPPFDFGPDFERKMMKATQLGVVEAIRKAGLEAKETDQ